MSQMIAVFFQFIIVMLVWMGWGLIPAFVAFLIFAWAWSD
jgi:hypothetical protein